jgi:hypothetical protein
MKIFNHFSKTTFLTFILMAFVFAACKDDDDDNTTPEDNNAIVGKWQLTAITPETAGTTIPGLALLPTLAPCIYDLKFTFTSDNKVTLSDCDAAVLLVGSLIKIESTTTWKVEPGKLMITNGSTTNSFGLVQNTNDMKIIVNTNTSGTGAAVNAVLALKRL